jgi:hypothetical protein
MAVGITVDFHVITTLALDRRRRSRACGRGGIGSGTRGPALSPVVANVASPTGRDAIRAMAPEPGSTGYRAHPVATARLHTTAPLLRAPVPAAGTRTMLKWFRTVF